MTAVMPTLEPVSPVEARVEQRFERFVWSVLLATITLIPVAYALLTPRGYHSASLPGVGTLTPSSIRALTSLLAVVEVGIAFLVISLALPVVRTPPRGRGTAVAAVALGGALLLSGWLHESRLTVGVTAMPLTVLAMALYPLPDLAWFEARLARCLRFVVWGSLAAALVVPAWAAQQGYTTGVVQGLHTRLAGLTPHPNALGPIAAVLVVLEWRRRPARIPLLVALAALVWSQSKTAWAALAIVAVIALYRWLRRRSTRRTLLPVVVLAGVVGVSIYLALGLLAPGHDTIKRDNGAETFTGRTSIWEVTLEVWQTDRLVGYGPDLWGDAMDRRYRDRVGFAPGHAHNQLIQTLGESGLLGAAALVSFLLGLGLLARHADRVAHGAAGSLFLVLVVDCFSEVPLQSIPFSTNFLLTMAVFAYALVGANDAG